MVAVAVDTARGKGKVRERKSAAEKDKDVLRIMAVSQSDVEEGELPGDPPPRFDARVASARVPRLDLSDQGQNNEAMRRMRGSMPVLLRDTPLGVGATAKWTQGYVASGLGPSPAPIEVLSSLVNKRRFYEYNDAANVYGSFYHVREPETQRLAMTPEECAESARGWTSRLLHVRLPVIGRQSARPGANLSIPPAEGIKGSPFAEEISGHEGWQWLRGLQGVQRFGPVLGGDLEFGGRDGLQPARYCEEERVVLQVAGRRRVLLVPPEHAFQGLYPYPSHHTYDRYAMVDLEDPDLALFPGAANVRGEVVVMRPGDVLYIPRYWFAHTQDLEAGTAALSIRLNHGLRARAAAAAPLAVSRAVEERVAAVEGIRNVRFWLAVLAAEEEELHCDLDTIKGYSRDEINVAVGRERAGEALLAMVDGRLHATTWLNANYREPLYLKDKPYWLEDDRSEWERKYPEFFREKLKNEGWNVPERVATVPIPGYNM